MRLANSNSKLVLEALCAAGDKGITSRELHDLIGSCRLDGCIKNLKIQGFSITGPGSLGRKARNGIYRIHRPHNEQGINPVRVLRVEVQRRRKENHEKRVGAGWTPRKVLALQQAQLLDWTEAQLEELDHALYPADPPFYMEDYLRNSPVNGTEKGKSI
jgi:hypothetical protein